MSIGLDTSVVMRLLTGKPEDQAHIALREVGSNLDKKLHVYVSDLVVSEAYFALQFHYGVPKDEALFMLKRFFEESGIRPLGSATDILSEPSLATAKPGFVDRLIHAEYIRHTTGMWTFEKASRRLKDVRVLQIR